MAASKSPRARLLHIRDEIEGVALIVRGLSFVEMKRKPDFEESSGNVFADLGFWNSKQEMLKAGLTVEIYKLLRKRRVTQSEAAKLLGTTQAQVSALMRLPVGVGVGRPIDGISERAGSGHRGDREARGATQGRRYVRCRAGMI
jgi:predicted XRE-type DNA-binding protein